MTALQRLADWLAADWGRLATLASNQAALHDGNRTVRGQGATLQAALGDALDRWEAFDDPQGMQIEPAPITERVTP